MANMLMEINLFEQIHGYLSNEFTYFNTGWFEPIKSKLIQMKELRERMLDQLNDFYNVHEKK